jgi:DNA-binding NtrC family response regulator
MLKGNSMRRGVLFVSPCREDATVLSHMLRTVSTSLHHVDDLQHARAIMQGEPYQVVLTEANLPDGDWRDVLELARKTEPASEVIVTDASADARFWAEALNLGAYDLIAQPFATAEVQRILSNACSRPSTPRKAASAIL